MMYSSAALQVLTDRSLFPNIVASASGTSFFVIQVYRQLECAGHKRMDVTIVGKDVCKVLESTTSESPDVTLWKDAMRTGDKRTLEALHVLSASTTPFGHRLCKVLKGVFDFALTLARDSGDTALADWLDTNGMFAFDRVSPSLSFQFGEQGDVAMLRWMHEHGYHINYEVASGAASSGNLDVLLFLQSVGPENATINESALSCAVQNGHLHVIEFLSHQSEWDLHRWFSYAYSSAIEAGQLRVVQYMHENGYECWDSDIDKAAKNGHVDVVRYMLENDIGIALDCALDQAAKRGHLEVVELLCESGCVISDYGVLGDVIKNHRFDIIQVLCQSGIDGAIRCAMAESVKLGKIEYVKFLYELDPVNCANEGGYHTADAAKRGYLDIIKFFHECGDPRLFDSRAMHFAAVHGHLDIVKFLHENREEGCKHFTPEYTHESGHHHIVDYLCENRPLESAEHYADSERRNGRAALADKIIQGTVAARAAGRKLYGFRND